MVRSPYSAHRTEGRGAEEHGRDLLGHVPGDLSLSVRTLAPKVSAAS